MPWVNGVFVSLGAPEFPAVTGDTILAEYYNAVINDLIDGMNNVYLDPGIPPKVKGAGAYTLILTDKNSGVYKSDAANITIPPNSSVAFPLGTVVSIYNFNAGSQTIVRGSGVSLYVPGSGTSGDKTIPAYTFASAWQFATNSWLLINGS